MRCSPVTPSPARRAPSSPSCAGGEIELCKGYGLASIELGVPITPQTRFRIASVSKQFTVTAALMLAAEGKLKLADPPHKYLRELKPLPVTIDQMMRNSSGLPDFLELLRLGGHGLDKPARAADLLGRRGAQRPSQLRAGQPLPLQQHQLPAARPIIERLTKKKLGDVLAERIFKPLGMTSTMLAAEIDTVIPNLATGYLGDDKRASAAPRHAYPQGGEGGLTSTVEDLLIWSRHFDNPVLGKTPARAARRRRAAHRRPRQHLSPRRRQSASCAAWRRSAMAACGRAIRTEFLRVPAADLTVIVIANLGTIDPWRLAHAIAGRRAGGRQAAEARARRRSPRPRSSRSPAPGSTPRSRRCSTWRGRTARRS